MKWKGRCPLLKLKLLGYLREDVVVIPFPNICLKATARTKPFIRSYCRGL